MPSPKQGGVLAKKPKGPPAKITLDRLQKLVGYVSNGLAISSAASAVGISGNTAFVWQRRGKLEIVRVDDLTGEDSLEQIPTLEEHWPTKNHWTDVPEDFDPVEWPFVVFALALEKAKSVFESRALTVISQAMTKNWQAAAWLLERKMPEQYGRPEARLRIAHEGSEAGSPVAVDVSVVSADEIERKFNEIEALIPGLDDDESDVVEAELVDDDSPE
jgi:hypothetical protein